MTKLSFALLVAASALGAQTPTKRAITFADFAALKGVSDPQLSPDGRLVLYAVRTTDVAANRRSTVTYLVPSNGSAPTQFPAADVSASEARWSPDGSRVAYIAGGQLWVTEVPGGAPRKLTALNGGATGPVWSPTGNAIVFTSAVWPECTDDACNVRRDSVHAASKVTAHVTDHLMYRHWNAWDEGTRNHLFVVTVDGSAPRDLTPGVRYDVPPGPFGGSEGYAVSPDGREVAYSAKEATRDEAWTTDVNLYTVPLGGGTPTVITASNKGADQDPVYSPDGRWIAYHSQRRNGYESDRWRLMLMDRTTKQSREVLPNWDRNADGYRFLGATTLFVQTVDAARTKFYRVAFGASGVATGMPSLLIGTHNNTQPSLSSDGRTIAWVRDATEFPGEVWTAALGPSTGSGQSVSDERALTHVNDGLVAQLALHGAEDYWVTAADGAKVHAFLVKPPNYEEGKKYPTILLIHGGPQGEWLDTWHSRWNYQMLAAPGFGLVVVNPRGSIGYGQQFVEQVSRDWGGRAYTDLLRALDTAVARNRWIDGKSLGATGGSYGGYMTNWIATHAPSRFKALATHAGIWNVENMYGATEEIWFPDWEYGGPYWDPKLMASQYRKWSPHLFASKLKTPQLVLHGELDYRVPYYEGVSLFTALQRQHVPSRFVVFPDEGHWIGKPQNQALWWREMQGWFAKYLLGTPSAM